MTAIVRFMTLWTIAAALHTGLAVLLISYADGVARCVYSPAYYFLWVITPGEDRGMIHFNPGLGIAILLFETIFYGAITAMAMLVCRRAFLRDRHTV